MSRGQQRPSTAPITLLFPKKRTGKKTDPCWPPLSREAVLNRFPVSIIPKSKLEKRQTQVSDRPSQKDRVVSFAKSKQAYLPKKSHVNKSQKKYNIYLYSYINIQRDQMLFYHWFTVFLILEQSMLGAVCLFIFSAFHRRSVELLVHRRFVFSSCPFPPYSNLWRHKMMMKYGK